MPGWLEAINAWAAIPLQILGFGIAYRQIAKTKKAAVAAREAAESAQAQIGSNLLLVILPQLTQIETSIEWAVGRGDRDAVFYYLGNWRWQAGQVRGHLVQDGDENETEAFLTSLQTSIATAADTKLALQDPAADLAKRTRAALKAIAVVTGMVGEMTARNTVEGKAQNGRQ